ncbi:MAG: hypothetical protein F6K41_08495 [Symploca sp. SIO3E6]|nr:hypothetical protein [Caldora sp. SIO3E6]
MSRLWLRWCDQEGKPIPTGAESSEIERQRADTQQQRADTQQQRADTQQQRAERLAQKLREMGVDPDQV